MSGDRHVVGIVGGACAGSVVAEKLAESGCEVVVFEQNRRPYGKIEDGLPRWHAKQRDMEYRKIDARLDRPEVHFVPNTRLGEDLDFLELAKEWGFSVLVLANGAWKDRELDDPRALGENAASCGDLDRAHAMLIEALRREPTDVVAWNDLGVVLHQGGALDAAALALRVAVELAPEDADLRLQLAVVSWSGGHLADAAEVECLSGGLAVRRGDGCRLGGDREGRVHHAGALHATLGPAHVHLVRATDGDAKLYQHGAVWAEP